MTGATEATPDPAPPADLAPPADPAPLSVAQEALWYLSLLVPNQISYNEAITIRKDGSFDVAAFRRAFDEIVNRHQAWRTTFDTVGGAPVQILQPAPNFDLPVVDLSSLTMEEAERQAVRMAAAVSAVPYDLRRGPLLRPRLVRFPGDHHRLYLAMHHLIFDGVSVYRVVLPELVALYDAFSAGRPSPLPDPPTSYADYARWEQTWISGPRVAKRLDYWREHLTPLPALQLPLDHPRPDSQRFRGSMLPLSVPRETVRRLRDLGQGTGGTLFQVLATVWSMLLSRYSGQSDVVFATATDLRQRPEWEAVVGYSLTPLVLRVDLGGDPVFSALVARVRNEVLDGLDNLVPFERLVRTLTPEGTANANPIYQTMIILEPPALSPDPAWSIHQMESELGAAVGNAKLDLELELDERPDGHLAGRLIYDRDLFDPATATRMLGHWLQLLGAVAADPTMPLSCYPVLTDAEERRQLVEWNATTTVRPTAAVHDLVRARATRQPQATAVSVGGRDISYAALHERAARVADRLRAMGAGPGQMVAFCAEASVELVVGLLGVLHAGAGYLLLDPSRPPADEKALVADAGARVVLVQSGSASKTTGLGVPVLVLDDIEDINDIYDGGAGTTAAPLAVTPAEPAAATATATAVSDGVCCVQYTAGEAGEPIGVALAHEAVVNLACAMADELGIGPAATVLVLPETSFGVPVMELWMALIAGARIVMAPSEVSSDGASLSRLIASERVSFLHASPSRWQWLIDTGLKTSRTLTALSGGGALSPALANQILDRCRVLWNGYGSIETTVYCLLGRVERSGPVTIGGPIANSRVYVVDDRDQPVPVGVTGNLLIAGLGVTAGYLNRPDLDDGAFRADRFGPGTAYRTGDRARWLANGAVELVASSPS